MENYVANVIPHLRQWWPVIIQLAYLVGLGFALTSFVLAVSGKHRFNRSPAVWTFVCAVLLLNLPAFMDSLAMTVFNQSSERSLSYSPPDSPASVYIQFAVYGIATIGVIGDTPNQPMNLSRGLVHLFGGIIAVNLVTFLRGLGATIGGDVQTYVARIIG